MPGAGNRRCMSAEPLNAGDMRWEMDEPGRVTDPETLAYILPPARSAQVRLTPPAASPAVTSSGLAEPKDTSSQTSNSPCSTIDVMTLPFIAVS